MPASTVPAYRQPSPAPVTAPDGFEDGLRKIARALRGSVGDLTDREKDWLYDLAREEARYPMPTVRKLCALSRRSRNPAVRNAFAELVRRECLEGTDVSVTQAFGIELRSNGPTDIAQWEFARDKNPITYQRAKAQLQEQIAASELALLAVVRWGRQQGLEGA